MKPAKPANSALLKEVSETTASTLGERLSRGRLARGLPVEEVARQMNLSASTIRALESDNHRGLPGRTFVRGYLRNYARIIGVPVEELVQAYDAQFAEEEEPVTFLAPRRRALRWLGPVIIAAGVVVLVAVLWGVISLVTRHWFTVTATAQSIAQPVISTVTRSEVPADEASVEPLEPLAAPVKQVISVDDPLTEGVVPASGGVSEAPEASATPPAAVAGAGDAGPAPLPALVPPDAGSAASVVSSQTSVIQPVRSSPPALTPVSSSPASNKGALAFTFSADCWIRVRDATGSNLYRGMMRGGASLALEGVPPFKVVVGNRAAVSLTYNGQPVAIEGDPANPVVTLNLGSP